TVLKKGVFCLVFHPHGWITNAQIIDLIDHAVTKHGKKVKFLTFREAQERIDKNLLGGQPLRDPKTGADNGVRLLDLDGDGYVDVIIGNDKVKHTHLWSPREGKWTVGDFPAPAAGGRFGVPRADGRPAFLRRDEKTAGAWHFDGKQWVEDK